MSRSLDEQLEEVVTRENVGHSISTYIASHTWFLLAVVAVRALIAIAKHIESMRPYHD